MTVGAAARFGTPSCEKGAWKAGESQNNASKQAEKTKLEEKRKGDVG